MVTAGAGGQDGDAVRVARAPAVRASPRSGTASPPEGTASPPAGTASAPGPSTALLTDRYELTMLRAALRSGVADRHCVFEVFTRRLPRGRRYGVVAGTGRVLDAIARFRFGADELGWLESADVVDRATLDRLAGLRFTGSVDGYPEGELYFPDSPVLTVEGTFAEAVLLETVVLSILNHDSAIAAAASRMVTAAQGRPCLEMGARRTHEHAAVAAARAAAVGGFAGTSDLEAGRVHGLRTIGTAAHAFTLLHDDEATAFAAQVAALGVGTTLLVDTYDVPTAVERAVAAARAAGGELGAVRLDSGDLVAQTALVRRLLDELGATSTRIVVTSDLDEHAIADLAAAPADSYGVGTSLVTGSGHPTSGFVYKLVARQDATGVLRPVAKSSTDKATVGGRKHAGRVRRDEVAVEEVLVADGVDAAGVLAGLGARPLQVPLVRDGVVLGDATGPAALAAAAERRAASLAELPPHARRLDDGGPAIPTRHT